MLIELDDKGIYSVTFDDRQIYLTSFEIQDLVTHFLYDSSYMDSNSVSSRAKLLVDLELCKKKVDELEVALNESDVILDKCNKYMLEKG